MEVSEDLSGRIAIDVNGLHRIIIFALSLLVFDRSRDKR